MKVDAPSKSSRSTPAFADLTSYNGSVRDQAVLRDDDDAVSDVIERVVNVIGFAGGRDDHVVPNARVLVDDGVFDANIRAEPNARSAGLGIGLDGLERFIVVA